MIELLLVAERLLAEGDLDRAGHLFGQVAEADPRNAIAVVGLARVARARGDAAGALEIAGRALAIDHEDAAAQRLVDELGATAPEPQPARAPESAPTNDRREPAPAPGSAPTNDRRSWLDRFLGFLRRR